jgi:hypothetical protein
MLLILGTILLGAMFTAGILCIESAIHPARSTPTCACCAYNLTGLIGEVGRCPECGGDFKRHPPLDVGENTVDGLKLSVGLGLLLLLAVAIGFML